MYGWIWPAICDQGAALLCKATGLGKVVCETLASNVCEWVAERVFCDVKPIEDLPPICDPNTQSLYLLSRNCDPNTQSCPLPPKSGQESKVGSGGLGCPMFVSQLPADKK